MAVVCLSVCPVPDPKSIMEGRRKLKVGSPWHGWPVTPFRGQKVRGRRWLIDWLIECNKQWCGLRLSVLGQDRSQTKKIGLVLSCKLWSWSCRSGVVTTYLPAARHHCPLAGTKLYCLRLMCVNNLPKVVRDSGAAGIWTRDLLTASTASYRFATEPHEE